MAVISINNLSFAHPGGDNLFENLTLQLDSGWRLGLIGRNGRGKTTFLELLAGRHEYSGKIVSPLAFDYFPFAVNDHERPALEVVSAIAGAETWQVEREAALLEVKEDALMRPFASLSEGERTKLLLVALFLREASFPLIDEPTNHLDMRGRETVARYLSQKRGFILVSHDRALLDRAVDHVLSINRGGIELQRGNFSSWQENRRRRDEFELARNDKLKSEVKRLEQSARQSGEWSDKTERGKFGQGPVDRGFIGRKAAKMMKRGKNAEARRDRALKEKESLLANIEEEAPLIIRPQSFHAARLVEAGGLSVSYESRKVLDTLDFAIMRGERLALFGHNGCGKSTLLKLIVGGGTAQLKNAGEAPGVAGRPSERDGTGGAAGPPGWLNAPDIEGEMKVPGGLKISYVPQDTSFLQGRLDDYARSLGIDQNLYRAVLHRLGFERGSFEGDLANFSAGQKKKALIAASLCEEAHLYVWDEPLNYIDVISRQQIEKLILDYQPSMILVEHDRAFIDAVATRVLELGSEEA